MRNVGTQIYAGRKKYNKIKMASCTIFMHFLLRSALPKQSPAPPPLPYHGRTCTTPAAGPEQAERRMG